MVWNFTEFVRLALTRGEWRFCAAGAILLVNLSESVAQWENADTSSGYSAKVSQSAVATLSGQTPNVPLSPATRGRLLSPAFLAPLVASFPSGVEQNMCDFPPICVWFSWSFSHRLWWCNKSNSLLPFEKSRNRSKTGLLFPEEEEEEKFSFLFVEAFLWTVEKSWNWGFDFIARKEKKSVCRGGEEEEEEEEEECPILFRV